MTERNSGVGERRGWLASSGGTVAVVTAIATVIGLQFAMIVYGFEQLNARMDSLEAGLRETNAAVRETNAAVRDLYAAQREFNAELRHLNTRVGRIEGVLGIVGPSASAATESADP